MESDLIHLLDGVVDKAFVSLGLGVSRGRPRVYPSVCMVKAFLVLLFKDLSSELDLVRFLERNPEFVAALGFVKLPHRTTFLRFRRRYTQLLVYLSEELRKQLPEANLYGVDATLEWKTDPDACWGRSPSKGWVFGFKFHVLSDLRVGLPVRVKVTPANKHESPILPKLVKDNGSGDYVMDSAFDSETNHKAIKAEKGFPAISRNKRRGDRKQKTIRNKIHKTKKRKTLLKKRWKVEPINDLYKDVLKLPTRLFRGIQNVIFYAQLTLLRLLTQAVWAYQNGKSYLARKINHFKHR